MLAALDALIEHGKGGRAVVALRQASTLLLKVGFDDNVDAVTLFDELMATLAMDLDDECTLVLAPELERLPGLLRAFTSTVRSRFHEISSRQSPPADLAPEARELPEMPEEAALARHELPAEPVASLTQPPVEVVSSVPGEVQPVESGPVEPAPRPLREERRAHPRDTAAGIENPLNLARLASAPQLEEIARLPALPEALTAIIATRGHVPAIVAALGNPAAAFGRSTLLLVAELSAGDRSLRTALASRVDLPPAVFDRLWPMLGRELRARAAMSGAVVSAEAARRALSDAEAVAREAAALGQPRPALSDLRASVDSGSLAMSGMICQLASAGRAGELAALAAAELGIAVGVAFAMLCARLDHPTAILVRALGGGTRALESAIDLRRGRALGTGGHVLGAFELLDADEARLLARLIDRNHAEPEMPVAAPVRPVLALVS